MAKPVEDPFDLAFDPRGGKRKLHGQVSDGAEGERSQVLLHLLGIVEVGNVEDVRQGKEVHMLDGPNLLLGVDSLLPLLFDPPSDLLHDGLYVDALGLNPSFVHENLRDQNSMKKPP